MEFQSCNLAPLERTPSTLFVSTNRNSRFKSGIKHLYTVHYDLLFQNFSKFQKWYQKLPSYVCRNTQKFYQAEACTLGDIAIFVSRVGRGKSGNLTHFTTKMSTFFEFSREKSNLRGFAAAMTYIFIN